jgi:hypothetical protein
VKDPLDFSRYIAWFKAREPLLMDSIKKCIAVLNQQRDDLTTLETISEARIA